ncbi:MAG: molybdopterin cofactor-binding domain-containing protein [Enterocloster bolteae]
MHPLRRDRTATRTRTSAASATATNNPPAGAFRGFGVCQSEFALESNINLLAEKVGISPWEIRYRNAIEPGKVLPNGQISGLLHRA